jgi:hypothetical protein
MNPSDLVPGLFVRLPAAPEWGIGQVQSVIGDRITITFEHAGKRLVNAALTRIERIADGPDDLPR